MFRSCVGVTVTTRPCPGSPTRRKPSTIDAGNHGCSGVTVADASIVISPAVYVASVGAVFTFASLTQ